MEKGGPNNNHAAADLPDDLIVEILARLPAGSLCQCKCVSRSWRSLISDPTHRARLAHTLSGFFIFSRPHSAARSPPPPHPRPGASSPPSSLSFIPSSHGEIEIDWWLLLRAGHHLT
ncbi:unnamed protein product [Urochloa humidicola]